MPIRAVAADRTWVSPYGNDRHGSREVLAEGSEERKLASRIDSGASCQKLPQRALRQKVGKERVSPSSRGRDVGG